MKIMIFLFIFCLNLAAEKSLTELAEPIVAEGKRLYRLEIASWHGTDLFLNDYKDRSNVGGYFSYAENDMTKCVFFSHADNFKIIGTIIFDSTYNLEKAKKEIQERKFTTYEKDIFTIRKIVLDEINTDSLFKMYKNTNLNLIPVIDSIGKRVYVLTGPQQNGVVIFGNDYLLTFDQGNKLINKKQLHSNIMPIYFDSENVDGKETGQSVHSHLPETGDFITATDICTLMLYSKYAKWKQHNVYSEKYMNMWNCSTESLMVMPMSTIRDMYKDEKKDNAKQEKKE